ncbi:unnamed protein product [Leptosia nina]|uniref:Uncharacterized protein n=1 Tax=Leptosia nina TaxID=320188 RepID=A0AAV1J539_9NEOP
MFPPNKIEARRSEWSKARLAINSFVLRADYGGYGGYEGGYGARAAPRGKGTADLCSCSTSSPPCHPLRCRHALGPGGTEARPGRIRLRAAVTKEANSAAEAEAGLTRGTSPTRRTRTCRSETHHSIKVKSGGDERDPREFAGQPHFIPYCNLRKLNRKV